MSEIYVVIGAPRSGTSLTAGILHLCGVSMFPAADKALLENAGDAWNQGGHFADLEFFKLIDRRLPNLSLPDPNWLPDPEGLAIIEEMVSARSVAPKWGFKGLHAWIGAAVLQQIGHDVRILNTSRPLEQSQASYVERVGPESDWYTAGADFVAGCKAQADAFYNQFTGPKMIADFDLAFADPAAAVSLIAGFAGVASTQAAIDFVNVEWRRFS